MVELHLKAGPMLVRVSKGREPVYVTAEATQWLYVPVQVGAGVTLGDIFRLLDRNPALQSVYSHLYVQDWLDHLRDHLHHWQAPAYDPEAVEVLEVCHVWGYNSHQKTLSAAGPTLQAMGFELREPFEQHGVTYEKGHRRRWGIGLADVRDSLGVGLQVQPEVVLLESDIDSRRRNQVVTELTVKAPTLTLGGLLHCVLHELSHFGGPRQQQAMLEKLKADMGQVIEAEVQGQPPAGIPLSDYFARVYRQSIETLFESIGEFPPGDVFNLLREVEDAEPVQAGIIRVLKERGLAPGVTVRAEHQQLPGREFRGLFRSRRTLSRTPNVR